MKYLFCFVLLPCLLAAEVTHVTCPNGDLCPFGKTCCDLPDGVSGCCDLPKEDLEDKRLAIGSPAASPANISMAQAKEMQAPCRGTQCGIKCHPGMYNAVCCLDYSDSACPSGSKCCRLTYSSTTSWCCARRQRCSTNFGYCKGSATTAAVSVASVLFAFFLIVTSKHFL